MTNKRKPVNGHVKVMYRGDDETARIQGDVVSIYKNGTLTSAYRADDEEMLVLFLSKNGFSFFRPA